MVSEDWVDKNSLGLDLDPVFVHNFRDLRSALDVQMLDKLKDEIIKRLIVFYHKCCEEVPNCNLRKQVETALEK